jgi:hypothetical protein
MNPEEEEFRAADALLASAQEIPRLASSACVSEIQALVCSGPQSTPEVALPTSTMFFLGDELYVVEILKLTGSTPPLILQSFGPTQELVRLAS